MLLEWIRICISLMLSFWKLIEWWDENKNEEKCEEEKRKIKKMKKMKMKKIEEKKWRKQKRALWNVNQDNEKCWRDARDECDSSYSKIARNVDVTRVMNTILRTQMMNAIFVLKWWMRFFEFKWWMRFFVLKWWMRFFEFKSRKHVFIESWSLNYSEEYL
jgi:hypothetical protein